jgi:microcystin degradation protein MlrC
MRSTRPLRIAFGRINQETNALSPVPTTLSDFKAVHYFDDAKEILHRCEWRVTEVDSMFRNAELSGFVQGLAKHQKKRGGVDIALVPLLSAWAVPGGPLSRACFDALTSGLIDKIKDALADGPLDGVYLSLHGAMNVDGLPLTATQTPESEIVRQVREVVGPQMPVVVSLDLHGNLTGELVACSTFIQAYQTNPHRDHAAVGARCARVLLDTALGFIAPKMVWRSLPMLLGGGNTVDFLKPMRPIFQRMRAMERGVDVKADVGGADKDGAVLGVSLLTVHPWNRHPELGWGVLVAVDGKAVGAVDVADRCADELAELAWGVRHQLPPAMGTPEAAITRARKRTFLRKTGVVVVSDASDVVSAGAAGENTVVLRALVEATDLVTYSTIRDPALVDELFRDAAVGDTRTVTLGKKLDPQRGERLELTGTIQRLGTAHGLGRHAVIQVDNASIVVVEGPALAVKPGYYKDAGLNPWRADVVMVKNFFPFLLFFAPLMRDVIFIKTSGVTDFDASFVLDFAGPMHPRDMVSDWRATDMRRRALPLTQTTMAPSSSSLSSSRSAAA